MMINYINKSKKPGNISVWIVFLGLLLIIIMLCSFLLEKYLLVVKADKVKSAIVMSNLAIYKNLDVLSLGDTPSKFEITNPYAALDTFRSYIQKNMNLDVNMIAKSNSVAIGLVNIKTFNIYNINGNTGQIYTCDYDTMTFTSSSVSDITTSPIICPTGQVVKKTSIYSLLEFNIDFMMKGIIGNSKTVDSGALTDISY